MSAVPEGVGRLQSPVRRLLAPVVRRCWKMRVEGLENVPDKGPAVLCPNHAAFIDSLFVPSVLARNLIFVGKAEYLDDWKTRSLFPALGMIPIDRRGGDHAEGALDAAREVLRRGGLFAIYPEGTRSRSGKLHKGHTGAARLAVETGAPLIPVGLIGTAEIQPPDKLIPKIGCSVVIRFGKPISVERYRNRVGDRNIYRELTDEVMYEIAQLTGLEYVHQYASRPVATAGESTAEAGLVDARTPAPAAAGATGPIGESAEAGDADDVTVLAERRSSQEALRHRPLQPLAGAGASRR